MSTFQGLRECPASRDLLESKNDAFMAGYYYASRNMWLRRARTAKAEGSPGVLRLMIQYARHDHHAYLCCIKHLKARVVFEARMSDFDLQVVNRIRGRMQ